MRSIFIHCGFPKTGSSALQVQLAQRRQTFLGYGINYLETGDFMLGRDGKIGSGNGVNLARAYLPAPHPESLAPRRPNITRVTLDKIGAAEGDVVFSSEFFSAVPAHLMKQMVSALSEYGKVVLIYFVRNQANLMAANYMQQVKRHRLQQRPEEYYANWDSFKQSLNYHELLKAVREACPDAELRIEAYEKSKTADHGLLGLFFEMIGLQVKDEDFPADTPINTSLSSKELMLMLEINKHSPRMEFSDMLVESSARAGRARVHAAHDILPPDLRQAIGDHFRDSNQAMFDEMIGGENLYSDMGNADNYTDLSQVQFDAAELAVIMSALMVDIDRRLARVERGMGAAPA